MAASALAWSILLTSRIVLLNCGARFKIPSVMTVADLKGGPVLAIFVLALPIIGGPFTQQSDFRPGPQIFTPSNTQAPALTFPWADDHHVLPKGRDQILRIIRQEEGWLDRECVICGHRLTGDEEC
jgi:hypothetical protein